MTGQVNFPNKARRPHSDQFEDIVLKLLTKDKDARLGAQGGVQEILAHEWFQDIDREALENKTITPEYIPEPFSVETSAKFFDMKSSKQALKESVLGAAQLQKIA